MITKIEYRNEHSEILTLQQAEQSRFHFKYIYEDNQLKKIEKYVPTSRTDNTKILGGGEYYLSDNEDYEAIVSQYAPMGKRKNWTFYFNKQTNSFGDYSWEIHAYYNEEIERKWIKGYNGQNDKLFYCEKSLIDNQIIGKKKYLTSSIIEQQYDSGLVIVYDDNDDTEIEKVVTGWEGDTTYYSLSEFIDSGITNYFDWYGNPYYHSFYPMLPSGPIV
jgi:hypothetical protein